MSHIEAYSFILKEQNMHIYFRFIWMGSKTQIWCCLLLPVANRGRPVLVQRGLHHWALSHMPARVVYLSAATPAAAAAVEDCGIRVGRKEEEVCTQLLCAPAPNPLVFILHTRCSAAESRARLAVSTVCLFTVHACTCDHVGFWWCHTARHMRPPPANTHTPTPPPPL